MAIKLSKYWEINGNVNIYNSIPPGQTPPVDEDRVIWSKAPEQLLSRPYGEIIFSTYFSEVKNEFQPQHWMLFFGKHLLNIAVAISVDSKEKNQYEPSDT